MEYLLSAVASWLVGKVFDAGLNILRKYLFQRKSDRLINQSQLPSAELLPEKEMLLNLENPKAQ